MDAGQRTATTPAVSSEATGQADEALWLCFGRERKVVVCQNCGTSIRLPPAMLIHARSLGIERWHLRCDVCDHPFGVDDFMLAGAILRRGSDAILGMQDPN